MELEWNASVNVAIWQCIVFGKPEPTYSPTAKDENLDKLEELMVVLYNIPTATPAGITCKTNCYKDDTGVIDCTKR